MSERSQSMTADWWCREADRYCQLHIEAHKKLVVAEARARQAEAAARDFASVLLAATEHSGTRAAFRPTHDEATLRRLAMEALARHPSFSGEEGT